MATIEIDHADLIQMGVAQTQWIGRRQETARVAGGVLMEIHNAGSPGIVGQDGPQSVSGLDPEFVDFLKEIGFPHKRL